MIDSCCHLATPATSACELVRCQGRSLLGPAGRSAPPLPSAFPLLSFTAPPHSSSWPRPLFWSQLCKCANDTEEARCQHIPRAAGARLHKLVSDAGCRVNRSSLFGGKMQMRKTRVGRREVNIPHPPPHHLPIRRHPISDRSRVIDASPPVQARGRCVPTCTPASVGGGSSRAGCSASAIEGPH